MKTQKIRGKNIPKETADDSRPETLVFFGIFQKINN